MDKNHMINVGFIPVLSKEWMGGVNYYKNLLYALSLLENKKIHPVVFIGKKTDVAMKNTFKKYATVIEHAMFDKKSFQWFLWKVLSKQFDFKYFFEKILKKYDIDVLSHSKITNLQVCKTINWITDFQHLHLSEMFSENEVTKRNHLFMEVIKNSDAVLLSSADALKDFKAFAPEHAKKAKVLQFVSQPDVRCFALSEKDRQYVYKKYNLPERFYYIPNQFWKHKNHMLVFEAVNILKQKGVEINVVCTGYMNDYRNANYMSEINNFISDNGLNDNIRRLGLVDYADVFTFMRFSIAVINPSLFEGWSSTVEECKGVKKNIYLSDIPIHREQNPDNATYFNPYNPTLLAQILLQGIGDRKGVSFEEKEAIDQLKKRTLLFAKTYTDIIESLF